MCEFFSFVTEPEGRGNERFYFNWDQRKEDLTGEYDSHSTICKYFKLKEDNCNKYEYNPLTKELQIDQINSDVDDSVQVEAWVEKLNWKKIIKPLIIKPIIHPFRDIPEVEQVTEEHIEWLKDFIRVWASVGASVWDSVRDSVGDSVRDSVRDSVWDSVWASVRDSVGDSVWASVRDSVGASVWDSVWASVRVYVSGFFNIKCDHDFSSGVKLWEAGLIPSFDGTTWRLHTGKDAKIIYEMQ